MNRFHKKLPFLEKLLFALFLISLTIPLSKTATSYAWSRVYLFDFFLFPLFIVSIFRNKLDMKPLNFVLELSDFFFLLFLLFLIMVDVFGLRPEKSFEGWFVFFRCFLIYLYITRNVGKRIDQSFIMSLLFSLILFESALAIIQYLTQTNIGQINNYFGVRETTISLSGKFAMRAPGTFIQTNILAGWLLYGIFVLSPWSFTISNRYGRFVRVCLIFIAIPGLFLTFSRVKIFLLFIGMLILIVWSKTLFKWKASIPKGFYFLTLIVIMILVFVNYTRSSKMSNQIFSRFYRAATLQSESYKRKFNQMEIAFNTMIDYPFTGIGQRNFSLVVNKKNYPFSNFRKGILACHNVPMKIGAESGFLGFAFFLLIIIAFVGRALKRLRTMPKNDQELVQFGSILCCLIMVIDIQFNTVIFHPSFFPFFSIIIGLSLRKVIEEPVINEHTN